jgi:hypothetical protein
MTTLFVPPKTKYRIGEAMTEVETTNETWCEADIQRAAGEIAAALAIRGRAGSASPLPRRGRSEAAFHVMSGLDSESGISEPHRR